MKQKVLIALSLLTLSLCSPRKDYPELASKSQTPEVDLFLIPRMYNLLEGEWIRTKARSSYHLDTLQSSMAKYGQTLNKVLENRSLDLQKDGDTIWLTHSATTHFTGYSYDRRIPLLFIGPKWIRPGRYSSKVNQQHIAPTLAKILGVRKPNGVEVDSIDEILLDTKQKPKGIVLVVIDQGGMQLLETHPKAYPNLSGLMAEGAFMTEAEVGHIDVHTGPGHAAIGTGAYPRKHGLISNAKYYVENGNLRTRKVYKNENGDFTSLDLHAETLAEVVDAANDNQSVVISQCYAPRASVSMAGHGTQIFPGTKLVGDKDSVYWLDSKTGNWTTESNYYSLPTVTSQFNSYDQMKRNHPEGWRDFRPGERSSFAPDFDHYMANPYEVENEGEMFRSVVDSEVAAYGLEKDDKTDMFFVTFKATDATGHKFGWESQEAFEVLAATDKQIQLVFEKMKSLYGQDFVMVVTADHGCAPMPEFSQGKRYLLADFVKEVDALLPDEAKLQNESLIRFLTVGQVSLNREVMKKYLISEEDIRRKILAIKVEGEKFFSDVLLASKLSE